MPTLFLLTQIGRFCKFCRTVFALNYSSYIDPIPTVIGQLWTLSKILIAKHYSGTVFSNVSVQVLLQSGLLLKSFYKKFYKKNVVRRLKLSKHWLIFKFAWKCWRSSKSSTTYITHEFPLIRVENMVLQQRIIWFKTTWAKLASIFCHLL